MRAVSWKWWNRGRAHGGWIFMRRNADMKMLTAMRQFLVGSVHEAGVGAVSRKHLYLDPLKFLLKLLCLAVLCWVLGEFVGQKIEAVADGLEKCQLPSEVMDRLRSTLSGGSSLVGRSVLREKKMGVCDSFPKVVDSSLASEMIVGEIPPVYTSLAEIIYAYNAFVSISQRNDLQYIHRPFLNMRSANGEVIDFVEGFLGFGQQEVSLLNLYYAPDLSIRQTQLPFNPDVVDRYIRDEVKSKQGGERLLFIRNIRADPKFEKNFLYSGPWFRAKQRCSSLRALTQSEFTEGRINVALSVGDLKEQADSGILPFVMLARRIVLLLENHLKSPMLVDVHMFVETSTESNNMDWLQAEVRRAFHCRRCNFRLHKFSTGAISQELIAFKHLVEAEILVSTGNDLSIVASAFSRNVKVVSPQLMDTDGMIFVVPTESVGVVEDIFRAKFNKRFRGTFELSELPGESTTSYSH